MYMKISFLNSKECHTHMRLNFCVCLCLALQFSNYSRLYYHLESYNRFNEFVNRFLLTKKLFSFNKII